MMIQHECEELQAMESERNKTLNDFQKALARLVSDPLKESLSDLVAPAEPAGKEATA